jgi:hypothetical protein
MGIRGLHDVVTYHAHDPQQVVIGIEADRAASLNKPCYPSEVERETATWVRVRHRPSASSLSHLSPTGYGDRYCGTVASRPKVPETEVSIPGWFERPAASARAASATPSTDGQF